MKTPNIREDRYSAEGLRQAQQRAEARKRGKVRSKLPKRLGRILGILSLSAASIGLVGACAPGQHLEFKKAHFASGPLVLCYALIVDSSGATVRILGMVDGRLCQ